MSESNVRRGSWRPEHAQTPASRRRWKYIRRGLLTTLAAVALIYLGYLLLSPFFHENSRVIIVDAPSYSELDRVPFFAQQLAEMQALQPALRKTSNGEAPVTVDSLGNVRQVSTLGNQLQAVSSSGGDVLMLYVAAHGVSLDREPYLACEDFTPAQTRGGLVPVQELLAQLQNTPARTRVLILDSGHVQYDPRQGLIANEFPRLLKQAVEQAPRNRPIWVLNSNSEFERSHISRALQRTAFGYFVTAGLKGPADLNKNKVVDVDELHRFVATHVAKWSDYFSNGIDRQTPMLLTNRPDLPAPVLLSVDGFPPEVRGEVNWLPSIADAQAGSRTFSEIVGTRDYFSTRTLIQQALTPARSTFLGSRLESLAYRVNYGATRVRQRVPAEVPGEGEAEAAADAPAEEGAEPGEDGAAGPTEEEKREAAFLVTIARLLTEGWQLRDDLVTGSSSFRPVVAAPHMLRDFERRWMFRENQYRSGRMDNQRTINNELRAEVRLLRLLATGQPDESLAEQVDPELVQQWVDQPLNVQTPHSLGLAESVARWTLVPLDESLKKHADELDKFLNEGLPVPPPAVEGQPAPVVKKDPFGDWVSRIPENAAHLSEFRYAAELHQANLDFDMLQLALQARRKAEQTAAMEPQCIAWVAQPLNKADEIRQFAENLLRDRIGSDSRNRARRLFQESLERYEAIRLDAEMVRQAEEVAHLVCHRFPHYLHWLQRGRGDATSGTPQVQVLKPLLKTMGDLRQLLDTPQPGVQRIAEVRRLKDRVEQFRQIVEQGLDEEKIGSLTALPTERGNAWRIEAMLATPLPSSDNRAALLLGSELVDLASSVDYQLPRVPTAPPIPTPVLPIQWEQLRQQVELEIGLVKLAATMEVVDKTARYLPGADVHLGPLDEAWLAVQEQHLELKNNPESPTLADDLWTAYARVGNRIQQFYGQLPTFIRRATLENNNLSDPQQRPRQLRQLRAARWALHWVDGQQSLGDRSPIRYLRRALNYDLLVWHRERLQRAEAFADAAQRADLAPVIAAYQSEAAAINNEPPPPRDQRPPLEVVGPSQISLTAVDHQDFEVEARNNGTEDVQAWIVLEYDSALVDLSVQSDAIVYRQLPPESPPAEAPKGLAQIAVSAELDSGSSASIPLRITRLAAAARAPILNVKAIAALAEDTEPPSMLVRDDKQVVVADPLRGTMTVARRYVKHTIELDLPIPPSIRLEVAGLPDSFTPLKDGVVMHPLPNHRTNFRLSIANASEKEKKVRVELMALETRFTDILPTAELTGDVASQLLARMGPKTLLEMLPEVTLPTDGPPVPLDFPIKAEAPPKEGETPVKPRIENGAILVLTDLESGYQSLKRLDFAPQRPRRYVKTQVSYNLATERFVIRCEARDPSLLPADGVKVRAEFAEPLPANIQARLEGEIKAPDFATELYVKIPPRPRLPLTLWIHVDEFPRAFVYNVISGVHARSIPEDVNRMAVRILSPKPGTAFLAPEESYPVEFSVDAPVGSFKTPNDYVEIGFDEDRDREFRDDVPLRFFLDRQVKVFHHHAGPGGLLAIDSQVGDFKINVPGRGLQNVQVNVMGQVIALKRKQRSIPVPIGLDAAPPELRRIKITPRRVDAGLPVKVTVWGSGRDLSGIGKVEAAFDTDLSGEFGSSPPIPAIRQPDGAWVATVPTTTPGTHTLLIRATDTVGNEGDYLEYDVEVVNPLDVAQQQKASSNAVSGQVVYQGKPLAETKVRLLKADGEALDATTSDSSGNFRFAKVPVGSYTLEANGLKYNRQLFAKPGFAVTVDPPPKRIRLEVVVDRLKK